MTKKRQRYKATQDGDITDRKTKTEKEAEKKTEIKTDKTGTNTDHMTKTEIPKQRVKQSKTGNRDGDILRQTGQRQAKTDRTERVTD